MAHWSPLPLFLLLLAPLASAREPLPLALISEGTNERFHTQGDGPPKHDLSGAAFNGRLLVMIDDGGSAKESNYGYNALRVAIDLPASGANVTDVPLPAEMQHEDLEAAAHDPVSDRFIIASSLSNNASDVLSVFNIVVSFPGGETNDTVAVQLENAVSRPARALVLEALRKHLVAAEGAPEWREEWLERVMDAPAKAGGLNVEGLAVAPDGALLLGLRSPLLGERFATLNDEGLPILNEGDALVVRLGNVSTFFDGTWSDTVEGAFARLNSTAVMRLDLGGRGVRAMSDSVDVPSAFSGFIGIAGPAPKATDYEPFAAVLSNDTSADGGVIPTRYLQVPDFAKLCRPEGAAMCVDSWCRRPDSADDDDAWAVLAFLSEASGPECADAEVDYLLASPVDAAWQV